MRLLLATLVAPFAVPAVFALFIMAMEPRWSGVSAAIVVGIFSLLFAYAATIVFGIPVYLSLRDADIGVGIAAAIGAVIGLFVFGMYFLMAQPAANHTLFFAASAAGGAASAWLFLVIARPVRSQ